MFQLVVSRFSRIGVDPTDSEDLRLQKTLLLYWDPSHHDEAREALKKAGRADLIGKLVPPAAGKGALPRYMKHAPKRRKRRKKTK